MKIGDKVMTPKGVGVYRGGKNGKVGVTLEGPRVRLVYFEAFEVDAAEAPPPTLVALMEAVKAPVHAARLLVIFEALKAWEVAGFPGAARGGE